jgi:hypothetical protein
MKRRAARPTPARSMSPSKEQRSISHLLQEDIAAMLKDWTKHITRSAAVAADLVLFDDWLDAIEREPESSFACHPMDVG